MTARGYVTRAQVASYLGATFTSAQNTEADLLIEAAEEWIDARTGQAWLAASPTTEYHAVPADGVLRLHNRPVTAITSVNVRSEVVGDTNAALVAGSTYELRNATQGRLLVSGYPGYTATVVYTHSTPVPETIALAAKLLVAHWMTPILTGAIQELRSVAYGQDLKLDFAQTATERGVPPRVEELLGVNRRLVFA